MTDSKQTFVQKNTGAGWQTSAKQNADESKTCRQDPIRVLHVLGTLDMGGAESRVMDLYRHIDREKVQFDFLIHDQTPANADQPGEASHQETTDRKERLRKSSRPKGYYENEAENLGARIFVLPRFKGTNFLQYRREVRDFFETHSGEWKVVEGHMTSTAAIYLPEAKRAGVPVTAAHARSAGTDAGLHGAATKWLRRNLDRKCDFMLSCSKPASESVFGKKAADSGQVMMVPNALETTAFRFDPEKRAAIRKEFDIPEDAFVIGHVGRFDAMKNQAYLAEAGKLLMQMISGRSGPGNCTGAADNPVQSSPEDIPASFTDLRFVFVGTNAAGAGDRMADVRSVFSEAGLEEKIIFAGRCDRERTIAMYQAFDAFAFPSLYEGLPGTVIEAQAAGLPCVIADTITDEVCVTPLVEVLSLDDPQKWAEALAGAMKRAASAEGSGKEPAGAAQHAGRAEDSENALASLDEDGFEISGSSKRMQEWYLHVWNQRLHQ